MKLYQYVIGQLQKLFHMKLPKASRAKFVP